MWNMILIGLAVAAAPGVDLQTLDGQRVQGKLVVLDAQRVVLETADGRRSLAVADLMSLKPSVAPRSTVPLPIAIDLVDGSRLCAEQFVVTDGRAQITRPFGPATFSTDAVRSVRFVEADEPVLSQWSRLLEKQSDSDVLVVRKGDSLNYHRGILRNITSDRVEFDLDGEVLRVKRSKVFGLVYYHPPGRVLAGAVATLTDTIGSRWTVRALALEGNVLEVTTPAGLTFHCPLARLARLDFSEGKIVYLGQLKPRSVRWTPYFGLKEEPPSREAFFAPLHDPPSGSSPLVLGGKRYTRGVALCSRTEVEYELPDGYRRFKAIAGIDDAYRPYGHAQLVIRADGRRLIETTLTGTEPPRTIDLDITGVGRLTILVDFGRAMDLGDHVDLCEARIVK